MRVIDRLRASVSNKQFEAALTKATQTFSDTVPAVGLESTGTSDIENLGQAVERLQFGSSEGAGLGPLEVGLEAIILAELRPAWLIKNDVIVVEGEFDHLNVFETNRTTLEAVAKSVGRVDLLNHATMEYVGTGWLVDTDIVVTNRHVAEAFASPRWPEGWEFATGTFDRALRVEIDTFRQDATVPAGRRPLQVTDILYVGGPREPDIAFLRVIADKELEPLSLTNTVASRDTPIAAIGYPASDAGRNDPHLMQQIFGTQLNVKRFSPGLINDYLRDDVLMLADYSTLGGNSGSAVVALETGEAVALHFAGIFGETNYAVSAPIVAAARRRLNLRVSGVLLSDLPDHAEQVPATALSDRAGYNPTFLGTGKLKVELPGLDAWQDDLAPVAGVCDNILRYTHFSVVQSASRRLPLLTVVNIDGARTFRLKRNDRWRTDGRLSLEHQLDNVLYKSNPLDRGHMVRRKDPGWGEERATATLAELDTFFYTNCAPQHKDLNRRDWVGLEDYILESAETEGYRMTVFTGPVFRENDRQLKIQPGAEDIQIPASFWKIAVMINADTSALSATAYLLTQGDLIRDITETAFVLGEYKTYQVTIDMITTISKLDFSAIATFDPLRQEPESVFGRTVRPIGEGASPILSLRPV